MAEYIEREAAIDALRDAYGDSYRAEDYIRAIPAADVKPINPAEWIEDGYQGLPCVCSYCGEPGKREWHFCPYCGATMKVAQDPASKEADT